MTDLDAALAAITEYEGSCRWLINGYQFLSSSAAREAFIVAELGLRVAAADRALLERHAPVPDHGRWSGCEGHECHEWCNHDNDDSPVCRFCRDIPAGDPEPWPCPDVADRLALWQERT